MPILMVCLLGILHTQKILFVRKSGFGASFEVAESLKPGHVSRVAMLPRTTGKCNVGHPTDVLGRALYNF